MTVFKPSVSVVVATLNRSRYLQLCLQALALQTAAPQSFEIIVVDNGSTDDTAAVVRTFCAAKGPVTHYLPEPRQGLSIARNSGWRAGKGAIIAFTDDDAVPDPDWVARIMARFEALDADVAVLGGEIAPIWEAPRPAWLTNEMLRPLSAGLLWGPTPRMLRDTEWLMEVNIAYRRVHLAEFGGFPEQLGRIGDILLSGEGSIDRVMVRAGLRLFYDPLIRVGHHIPKTRLTRTWFKRRAFWQGVSENRVHQYVEEKCAALELPEDPKSRKTWEEITVPASAAEWADLFDDRSDTPLEHQMFVLEQLGYLLQSQSLFMGR